MTPLPPIARWQLRLFARYVAVYLRRNFHNLYFLPEAPLDQLNGWPLLVCLNHPSWWDPLVALYLTQHFFPLRTHYAPMASAGLEKYRFFERLGFFGIDGRTTAGAARFLRLGSSVLALPEGAFWVTAQGHFTDSRLRPVTLERGVGHLARSVPRFAMLPLALEYCFWNERYPEAFACFGTPIFIDGTTASESPSEWVTDFSAALERTQDLLARHVLARDPAAFESLLGGAAGVGGFYDLWRRANSALRGRRFRAEHGGH